jgi:hypothetical protein
MASVDSNHWVSWDDFVRIRNSQDEQLGREFAGIRHQFDEVHKKFDEVHHEFGQVHHKFDQVHQKFDRVDQRFEQVNERLDRVELLSMRTAARFQNYTLKNPILRIAPIPAYDPKQGIIEPNLDLFPRHAKDFYALRDPSTLRHRQILVYLVSFYDIQLSAPEDSDEDDDQDDALHFGSSNERAVEMLEGILGLNEDNFVRFRERAAELRRRSPPAAAAAKRPQPQEPERRQQQRPWIPAPAENKSHSSEGLDRARVEWRTGDRSTPSSQRVTFHNLRRKAAAAAAAAEEGAGAGAEAEEPAAPPPPPPGSGGDSDSTRAFTNPLEP